MSEQTFNQINFLQFYREKPFCGNSTILITSEFSLMCVRDTLCTSSYDCFLNISLWSQTDFSLSFQFTMFLYVELGGHNLAHRSCLMLGVYWCNLASAVLLKGMSSKFLEQRFLS